jgi:hypothetical protein
MHRSHSRICLAVLWAVALGAAYLLGYGTAQAGPSPVLSGCVGCSCKIVDGWKATADTFGRALVDADGVLLQTARATCVRTCPSGTLVVGTTTYTIRQLDDPVLTCDNTGAGGSMCVHTHQEVTGTLTQTVLGQTTRDTCQ